MRTSQIVQNERRGIALIIVLAMLVLVSGLLVAFLSTATIERGSSYANANAVSARQIADSTVSFAIGHIRDATSVADEQTTWASQPGAIRTFSGTLSTKKTLRDNASYDVYGPDPKDEVYKLYSADRMKVKSADYANTDLPKEVEVIDKWDPENPTPDYVDLNEPLLIARRDIKPDGTVVEPRYPIIDPRAALDKSENPATGNSPGIIEGFDARLSYDAHLQLPSGSKLPYLPMPVKWLYELADGTMGPSSLATENNPIVGRTAFWTDDETCKLNINTASEGTYWDTPTASSLQECGVYGKTGDIPASNNGLNLAASQPVQGEYQRYPGHPAQTCLSPVLGWLFDLKPNTPIYPYGGGSKNLNYWKFKEAMYEISPFVPGGQWTSQGAMRNTDVEFSPEARLNIKTKHLYSSVDELLFKPKRFNGPSAEINSNLTAEALERARFFLTAGSRAPELNLYSRPRVTIWPINADYRYRTSFDDLFIFASTIAKGARAGKDKGYYLLREDAKNPLNDFIGNFKSGTDDQNQQMFSYLQWLTDRNVPGFGKNFAAKWGQGDGGRDLMLTMMFDYVRTVNVNDTGASTRLGNIFAPYTPRFFTVAAPADQYARYDRSVDWSGQVVPLRRQITDQYQGLGRFMIPVEFAVVFHTTTDTRGLPAPIPGSRYMRASLAIEMSTAMPGYPALRETYWTRIVPHPAFRDGGGRPLRPAKIRFVVDGENRDYEIDLCGDAGALTEGLVNIPNVSSHEVNQGRGFMPTLAFSAPWYKFTEHIGPTLLQEPHLADPNRRRGNETPQPKSFANHFPESRFTQYKRGVTVNYYPYTSKPIPIPKNTKEDKEAGGFQIVDLGAYRLEIYAGEAPDDPRSKIDPANPLPLPVQVIDFAFPTEAEGLTLNLPLPSSTDLPARLPISGESTPSELIQGGDVVRSLEYTGGFTDGKAGDVRLAAAMTTVPSNYYTPVGGLAQYKSGVTQLHRLQRGHGNPEPNFYQGAGVGKLVVNAVNRGEKPPMIPNFVNGVVRTDGGPGDWDRGLSKHMSGAFGNKVDEGNLKFDPSKSDYTGMPYYRGRGIEETGQTYFSPNRQISSPVMFGSLPTGVIRRQPWQTLLFRPSREAKTHPGADLANGPPDHLALDLFNMPVVEPYAISEPFSTMGKVNMNYVIAPFGYAKGDSGNNPDTQNARSYIRRDTALRGVMKSTFVMQVPTTQPDNGHTENPQSITTQFRAPINLNRTLEEMETRLKVQQEQYPLFRSASEICTVDLYPNTTGTTISAPSNWEQFWNTYGMTGDNMRERPYAMIYPRLTTKSNVYTVHMRCQAIRQAKRSKNKNGEQQSYSFDPEKDQVVAEYRGSATIERFIDPNDEALKNYNEITMRVDPLYRYRIVNTKHFTPR
jgi:hypothetical protein